MAFWPDGCTGAVSLTFDDGLASQLNIAAPEMTQRGLRGTFYLNPSGEGDAWREKLKRWRPVFEAGHEMGNHSIHHPCFLNINAAWSPVKLVDMTLADLELDLREAQMRLMEVFPEQKSTSFAYPCYETDIGRGASRASYTPLIARLFTAGRAYGEMANDPLYCDLHHLSSWNAERAWGSTMMGMAERAAAQGYWLIYTFHGILEGHLPVALVDLIELLDHLVRRKGTIWTAPTAEVADYIHSRSSANPV